MISSRNLYQLHGVVPFLGLHLWALVSYSHGDIVGLRRLKNIDLYNDFLGA